MLQVIHKYRSSFLSLLFVGFICLLMAGFGIDMLFGGQQNSQDAAIKVGETTISYREYNLARRQVEARYQQIFGERYDQMIEALKLDLSKQITDNLIDGAILEQRAEAFGLRVGDSQVQKMIASIFPNGFSRDQYANFLRAQGMSSVSFETTLRKDALKSQLANSIKDLANSSEAEARAQLALEKTSYDVSYVTFDPQKYEEKVAEPAEAALQELYENNATDFETEQSVRYDYLTLEPAQFESIVEISDEEVEFYYTENERDFRIPESVNVEQIRFLFPQENDPKAMSDLKDKAQGIRERALAGEDFAALAQQHSDDFQTATNGGDLGRVSAGTLPKELEQAVFSLRGGGVTEVVSTDNAYYVMKVSGYKAPQSRELSEVREEIIAAIKKREAPAYAAAKAGELLDQWSSSADSLAQFAVKNNLAAATMEKPLTAGTDPEPALRSLTARVLSNPGEPKQLIDLNEKMVLVEVKEYHEPKIQEFGKVREELIKRYKKREAERLAKEAAQGLLDSMSSGAAGSTLSEIAKGLKLEAQSVADIKRSGGGDTVTNQPEIRSAIFESSEPLQLPERVFSNSGKFHLFQVTAINPPESAEIEGELAQFRTQQENRNAQLLLASLIARYKSEAEIVVDNSIYN